MQYFTEFGKKKRKRSIVCSRWVIRVEMMGKPCIHINCLFMCCAMRLRVCLCCVLRVFVLFSYLFVLRLMCFLLLLLLLLLLYRARVCVGADINFENDW